MKVYILSIPVPLKTSALFACFLIPLFAFIPLLALVVFAAFFASSGFFADDL